PRPHMGCVRGEAELELLVAGAEVKGMCALVHGGEQQVAQQDLARRMPRQVGRKAWGPKHVASPVRVPVVKSERPAAPIDAREPEPAGMRSKPRAALDQQARLGIEKTARVLRSGPARDML